MASDRGTLEFDIEKALKENFNAQRSYGLIQIGDTKLPQHLPSYQDKIEIIKTYCILKDLELIYHHKPEHLSIDLYGTSGYWHLLLQINNMKNRMDFDRKSVYVINPTFLYDVYLIVSNSIKSLVKTPTVVEDLTIRQLL